MSKHANNEKKAKFSVFDDVSIKGEPEVKVVKIKKNRKSKEHKALMKKAAARAKKFREDEEKALISGKKFDKFGEMRKRRKEEG